MRQLPKRKKLPSATKSQLKRKTRLIVNSATPKEDADRIFTNSRDTKWFEPVVISLSKLAGLGGRCMLCSGSESSDVEHFRPLTVFPPLAMTWENFLWACTPCNREKSNQFPLKMDGSALLINPMEENVWNHFYIDNFGNLTPLWDTQNNDFNDRGKETMDVMALDRQALQEARRSRMDDLKDKVRETIASLRSGKLNVAGVKRKISKWRKQPFQPDVADYFLNGPGRKEKPFNKLFDLL